MTTPIACVRFRSRGKIEPNATAIPEYGSLCGKAYQFQVVGFSFFRVLHPERGKPCAIDARTIADERPIRGAFFWPVPAHRAVLRQADRTMHRSMNHSIDRPLLGLNRDDAWHV